jgi:hypothetical protein
MIFVSPDLTFGIKCDTCGRPVNFESGIVVFKDSGEHLVVHKMTCDPFKDHVHVYENWTPLQEFFFELLQSVDKHLTWGRFDKLIEYGRKQ